MAHPRWRFLRTTERAERGSALLIALAFMLVFSVLLTAILGYASTNARTSQKLIKQRTKNYAVDGTLESAVNWAKDVSNVGRDPDLYGSDPSCVYKKPASGSTPEITVSCAAKSGSGSGRGPDGGTYPAQAILTLGKRTSATTLTDANPGYPGCGTSKEDGVRSKAYCLPASGGFDPSRPQPTEAVTVRGDVLSKSTIKLDGNPLLLYPLQDGTVSKAKAALTCTGNARSRVPGVTDPVNNCLGSTPAPSDPGYLHRTIIRTLPSVPSSCVAGVTTFSPGTYTSAGALSDLFASPSCKGKWIWFTPGVYYFNFTDGNQSLRCGNPASSDVMAKPESNRHEWCIGRPDPATNIATNDVHIVGGTPYNWDGATPPTSGKAFPQDIDADHPYGGNCDPGQPGVQFIFGGDSRVYVADGSFELCAGTDASNPNAPRIAVYGIPEQILTRTEEPDGVVCGNRCTTNLVDGSLTIDDGKVVTLHYPNPCCGIHTSNPVTAHFTGYTVPPGNVVDSVVMHAKYNTGASRSFPSFCSQHNFGRTVANFVEKLFPGLDELLCPPPVFDLVGTGVSSACAGSKSMPPTTDMSLNTVDITSCFTANGANGSGLSDFRVKWYSRASCGNIFGGCADRTDLLDGIEIEVKLRSSDPSAEHPADGCIIGLPNYNEGIGERDCAVLKNDQLNASPTLTPVPSDFVGRTSIKGTVYAPSDAVAFSDSFTKYPWFERGLIARHLRIGSYRFLRDPSKPCASGTICEPAAHIADISPTPFVFPRVVTFTACTQASTGNQDVCNANEGDTVLGTVKVIYHVTPGTGTGSSSTPPAANRPEILGWAISR